MSEGNSGGGGIGFCGLLTVLFIGLKLTDHIDWSWWWVLSPLWLPACAIIGIFLIALAITAVVAAIAGIFAAVVSVFQKKKTNPWR